MEQVEIPYETVTKNTTGTTTNTTNKVLQQGKNGSKELEDLKYKISRLEKQITLIQNSGPINNSGKNVDNQPAKQQVAGIKPEVKKSTAVKLGDKVQNWPKIVEQIKQEGKISLYTNLLNSSANQINDMTVGIKFEKGLTPFVQTIIERPENMSEVAKQVSIELGKPMRVVLIDNNDEIVKKSDSFENITKNIDIPKNIID